MHQLTDGSVRFVRFAGSRRTSVFRDERVRQAYSMSWDRDQFLDLIGNISKYKSEGLEVESKWSSPSSPTTPAGGWILQGKDFGENAKYFKRDIAEAKKLLAAAGYASGVEVASIYPPTG